MRMRIVLTTSWAVLPRVVGLIASLTAGSSWAGAEAALGGQHPGQSEHRFGLRG